MKTAKVVTSWWSGWTSALRLTLFFVALGLDGCTAAQERAAVADVLDVSGAVCAELATQPEPAWVTFACTLTKRGASPVVSTFTAKVAREDAALFKARHCPALPAGGVSP